MAETSDFARQYGIQLYGFLVKTFVQRWRMPVSTVLEVLLPCLFTILMSIAYWVAGSTIDPAKMYDGGATVPINVTDFTRYFMCKNLSSTLKVPWYPCSPTTPASGFNCLALIGKGNEICIPNAYYAALSGILYSMYYGSGPFGLNTMDGHLALSAMVTQATAQNDPTFFGRNGQGSLSHYGSLIVSSDSAEVAASFMAFCRSKSGMCGEVLYPTAFTSLDSAQDYAAAKANTVWAIVDIPSASLTANGTAEFTISMNFTATASTSSGSAKSLFTRGTGKGDGSDGYVLYWTSGFMTLQTFVQEFFMQEKLRAYPVTGPSIYTTSTTTGVEGISKYLTQYGSTVTPMPTPPVYNNSFLTKWAYYMPLLAVMAALYPTSRLVMLIVSEKHNGIREAMLIMGLHPSCMFFGWYSSTLIMDIIASLLAAMFLKVGFLSKVDYGLLVLLYFSFMQQNTALCFFVSSVFRNPRVASWCIAFVLFVCAIPSFSFPDGMTDIQKIFCCLIPCVGYAEAFNMMLDYVSLGRHFGWAQAHVGYFNFSMAVGMMWASFGALMLLGFYLDRVSYGAVGRRAHPLFFLMPLYNLVHKRKAPMVKMSDMGTPVRPGSLVERSTSGDETPCGNSSVPSPLKKKGSPASADSGSRLIEHYNDVVDPMDPANAAVFHRLRKIYIGGGILGFFYTYFTGLFREGDRVVALDGVTFAMRTGEVSVLLGPNGAGKSTIMGMATGMVDPTNGDVYVRGYDARTHLEGCRQNIGYCPQRDIVWSLLTVEEHITFYARMKGSSSINVQEKVNHVMDLVDLMEKRHCKASNLSGGQRRRLCVAIAMVGDSSVLFLDEPTAGMDIKGRKTVYDALNRSRAQRSVLISTHLLDEADRIADRVLIVNKGLLCAEGSTMFLKSQMDVGYVVTCLLDNHLSPTDENRAAEALSTFVRAESVAAQQGGVEGVELGVRRRGREVSFRFPMSLLGSTGVSLLTAIQQNRGRLRLRNVSLNLTTLEDVFFTVTGTARLTGDATEGEVVGGQVGDSKVVDGVRREESLGEASDLYEDRTIFFFVFCRHFRALFLKRVHYAQRDIKLLVYQVLLPIIFLLLSLFVNLVRDPNQPALRLDMTMYSGYATNPSQVMTAYSDYSGLVQNLTRYPMKVTNAFDLSADLADDAWGPYYLTDYRALPSGLPNSSYSMSMLLMEELLTHTSPRYVAIAPVGAVYQQGAPKNTPTVLHNTTNSHAAPQGIDALYHLASHQLFGTGVPLPTVVNSPMKLGEFEKTLVTTNKQVMIGIFIILPFIFIPSNTISYIVEEKECGARHMQWLSGASVLAYWLSSFVFDVACYIVTQIIAFVIFVIFNRTEYIGKDTVGAAIVLFLFFGVTSVPVSYFMSFFFRSSFSAQSVVFCINFTFGFLWVTVESMIAEQALRFAEVVTYILRIFPAVCFGESMYVLSGTQLANMMFPNRAKSSLFALLHFTSTGSPTGGIGTGLIYMSCVAVGCTIALIVLEYLRLQRLDSMFTQCCTKPNPEDEEAHQRLEDADPSVRAEEEYVCADPTGPASTRIAVQHLNKRYFGAKHAAVEDISFGVEEGAVMGLLGLNGAGKTTTVSILAGEVVATGGEAFVNHYAVQSMASRSFVGYCPQYDALLSNLSAEEHLWLYARLRGIREKHIEEEVRMLLRELGLYPFRTQAAGSLSGGNKRRLSLAIALVGHTTSVLLDEPTSGMDAVARAQTCEMVRRLTSDKSVVLTTHLLDEVEALADRVAFVVRGNLRCVGTPQELKNAYNKTAAYTLNVLFPNSVHLQGEDAGLVEKIRNCVLDVVAVAAERETNPVLQHKAMCEVLEVHPCSVQLSVNGDLPSICAIVSQMQQGKVNGVPATTYVSVTQPTLEDILLLQ